MARETFYSRAHRMFWLVHLHDESAFHGYSFRLGGSDQQIDHMGRRYHVRLWASRSSQFIEKWKRSNANVFFDIDGHVFYLANASLSMQIYGKALPKGRFIVSHLSTEEFVQAVNGQG